MSIDLRSIGEAGLLQRLQAHCIPGVVGDDGAILTLPPGKSLVVTTDVLVDSVHFSDRTTAAADAGWRAAAANLSDLAAMGATPLGITVGLALPPDTPLTWIEELYTGLTACLNTYNSGILGGDVCRSATRTLAITALGAVDADRSICRHTARPAGAIVVTGYHGLARAGLELLLHPETGQDLAVSDRQTLVTAHQRPRPRLDVLTYLEQIRPDWIAGMDSSDGLLDAITQICQASSLGATLHQLPIAPALARYCPQPQEWILTGGEDFELVLVMPPAAAAALVASLGPGAAIIGHTHPDPDIWWQSGSHRQPLGLGMTSFQHFLAP
jgi:thiamine-monophosphate kinase